MKGLLIKDLKIIASQKRFFIVAILLSVLFGWTGNDVTFASTYLVLLISMLTLTTLSYDEFNGGMLFLLTLPVNRKLYTIEKYIFAFLNLIAGLVFSIIVSVALSLAKGIDIGWASYLSSTAGIMLAMGFMLSITIPLEFKFGAEKGRIAMISVIAGIFVIGMGVYKLLTDVLDINVKAKLAELVSKLPNNGENFEIIAFFVMLLLIILEFLISYLISSKIMSKKEF